MPATIEAFQAHTRTGRLGANADELPRWPITVLFAPYLLWWAVGLIDVILFPMATIMLAYLLIARGVRIPRAYLLWVVFLVWAAISFMNVQGGGQVIGFAYRYLVYLGASIVFVYVYNARRRLGLRYLAGVVTVVWLTVVAGGFLAMAFPGSLLHTPMANLVPQSLMNNDLVNHMVIRRFSQYNPNSYFNLAARPAAPFRYTNNWGNMYSLMLPVVVAYMAQVRGTARFWLLVVALPLSTVPAFLTLNRGMIIGIVVAMLYVSLRALMHGHPRLMVIMAIAGVVGYTIYALSPAEENNATRLDKSGSSTETRGSLYIQSIEAAKERPIFGYGVPQSSSEPGTPPVGTQGQVWMILVSHGPIGLALAGGWFVIATWQSRRRRDALGMGFHTSMLVATLELVFYGALPYALPVIMLAAAAGMRGPDRSDAAAPPALEAADAPGALPARA